MNQKYYKQLMTNGLQSNAGQRCGEKTLVFLVLLLLLLFPFWSKKKSRFTQDFLYALFQILYSPFFFQREVIEVIVVRESFVHVY